MQLLGLSEKVVWPKTPEQFKDLNDWTRAGATASDLVDAMANAEIVREAERPLIESLGSPRMVGVNT